MPPSDPSELVIALFGPTAGGKTAVAEALAERDPGGDHLRRLDAGLPGAAHPHQPALAPDRARRDLAARPRGLRRRVPAPGSRGHRRRSRGRSHAHCRRRHRPLPARRARRARPTARAAAGRRERWERLYDRIGPEQAHAALAERDPWRLLPSTRTTAGGWCGRSSSTRRVDRSHRPETASGAGRHAASDADLRPRGPKDRPRRTHSGADGGDVRAGVHDEVAGAVEGSISGTASKIIGLREVAERPREDAIAAIALRTRRYAAYQRKWMRRIPGIEAVSAVRSPEAVAADILALCRAE